MNAQTCNALVYGPMSISRPPNTAANDHINASNHTEHLTPRVASSDRQRTLVVVDAACDMPGEWLAENNIVVLPIKLSVADWELYDTHNEFDAMEFFRKDLSARGTSASTTPLSADESRDFIQSYLHEKIDYVLQVTITAARSGIYMNSLAAMSQLTVTHNRVRRAIGNRTPFKTWVVDSETGFTGQAVLLAETVNQLNNGIGAADVAASIERLRSSVHTLVVPKDLFYLYKRGHEKGDRSLSWLSYNVAQALDIKPIVHAHAGHTEPILKVRGHQEALDRTIGIAADHVKRGLTINTVCASYAGILEDIQMLASFRNLREVCERHNVELMLSTMSVTGGVNVGIDAFSIAFACNELTVN
jgi:DegV family protein with EDD domain